MTIHAVESYLKNILRHLGLHRIIEPDRTVEFLEFGAVGASGVLVNTTVFVLIQYFGGHYLLAGTLAFLAAVNSNFVGNYLITFGRPDGSIWQQYSRFYVVSIGGFIIYTLLLAGVVETTPLPHVLGNLLAIAGSSLWNYAGSASLVFE